MLLDCAEFLKRLEERLEVEGDFEGQLENGKIWESAEGFEDLQPHAASCVSCRRELEFALCVNRELAQFPQLECPDSVIDKVMASVAQSAEGGSSERVSALSRWTPGQTKSADQVVDQEPAFGWQVYLAAAAVIGCVLATSFLMGGTSKVEVQTAKSPAPVEVAPTEVAGPKVTEPEAARPEATTPESTGLEVAALEDTDLESTSLEGSDREVSRSLNSGTPPVRDPSEARRLEPRVAEAVRAETVQTEIVQADTRVAVREVQVPTEAAVDSELQAAEKDLRVAMAYFAKVSNRASEITQSKFLGTSLNSLGHRLEKLEVMQ